MNRPIPKKEKKGQIDLSGKGGKKKTMWGPYPSAHKGGGEEKRGASTANPTKGGPRFGNYFKKKGT